MQIKSSNTYKESLLPCPRLAIAERFCLFVWAGEHFKSTCYWKRHFRIRIQKTPLGGPYPFARWSSESSRFPVYILLHSSPITASWCPTWVAALEMLNTHEDDPSLQICPNAEQINRQTDNLTDKWLNMDNAYAACGFPLKNDIRELKKN